jgi:hypothetical protein
MVTKEKQPILNITTTSVNLIGTRLPAPFAPLVYEQFITTFKNAA